eukprot:470601-Amphidinium_carterae.1
MEARRLFLADANYLRMVIALTIKIKMIADRLETYQNYLFDYRPTYKSTFAIIVVPMAHSDSSSGVV